MRYLLAVWIASSLAGCVIDRATNMPVRRELATDCSKHCDALGMRLTAVVVVANAGGCVCEPGAAPQAAPQPPSQPAPQPTPRASGAAAAGGAVIMLARAKLEDEDRHRRERQMQSSQPPPSSRPWSGPGR